VDSNKKNILVAIPCLNRGGTEMQTLNLVRTLVNVGHDVTTLCYFEYNQAIVDEFEEAGCEVELMKLKRTMRPWQLVRLLRKQFLTIKPDVVHVQYMAPGALPILAAKLAGIKIILATVHQPYTPSHGILAKILLRASSLFCTRFIAVSQNAEISWFGNGQLYDENLPIKSQPCHFTIYNAVDVEQIREIQNKTVLQNEFNNLDLYPGKLVVGAVSRLRHEKGIDVLINAFSIAKRQFPSIHLLIVGSGPDEIGLKTQVSDLNLTSSTTFFGEANWETAMQQMALMDIVVVPSRFEGFGLTAAEAMAMGKSVVATDVFGLTEVVSNGQTGLLFPQEGALTLSNWIIMLCNNNNLRYTMGNNGRIKARKMFDFDVYKEEIIKLYDQLG
jgi:glycosyltransferase involved in cell wall biosynthesis